MANPGRRNEKINALRQDLSHTYGMERDETEPKAKSSGLCADKALTYEK